VLEISFFRHRGKDRTVHAPEFCVVPMDSLPSSSVWKRFKKGIVTYALYLGLFSPVHFFFGAGVGGIAVGLKYTGLFLSLGFILISFFIPVLGIFMAVWYNGITLELMAMLGLSHNFWIDVMIVAMANIIGVVSQIIIMTWITVKIVDSSVKGKYTLSSI